MSADREGTPSPPDDQPSRITKGLPHWAITGLATLGSLFLLGVLAVAGLMFLDGWDGGDEPAKVADRTGSTMFVVRQVSDLPGTSLIRMDIAADQSEESSPGPYYGGGNGNIRNIVLLDKRDGTARSILPDNQRRIVSSQFLPARADRPSQPDDGIVREIDAETERTSATETPPPAYYLLTVRSADDAPRTAQRETSVGLDLLVGTLSSGRQGVVMRSIDAVESSWMQSATQLGLIVRDDLALHYRVVDIPTLSIVVSKKVDIR